MSSSSLGCMNAGCCGIRSWAEFGVRLIEIENDEVQQILEKVQGVFTLALFIIGCVAAAGHMTGIVAGGCMVGLSGAALVILIAYLVRGNNTINVVLKLPNLVDLVATAILGSLAMTGVVSPFAAGWGVLSAALGAGTLNCAIACAVCCGLGKEVLEMPPEEAQRYAQRLLDKQAQKTTRQAQRNS